jgi:hypothetical protein
MSTLRANSGLDAYSLVQSETERPDVEILGELILKIGVAVPTLRYLSTHTGVMQLDPIRFNKLPRLGTPSGTSKGENRSTQNLPVDG